MNTWVLSDLHFGHDNVILFCNRPTTPEEQEDWNFIIGNHDKENQLKSACASTRHNVLGIYHEKKLVGTTFVMFHYPIENWNKKHYGSIHLHGHIHNGRNKLDIENRHNVCFDRDEAFRPYHIKEFL